MHFQKILVAGFVLLVGAAAVSAKEPFDPGSFVISGLTDLSRHSGNMYEDSLGNARVDYFVTVEAIHIPVWRFGWGMSMSYIGRSHGKNHTHAFAIGPKVALVLGKRGGRIRGMASLGVRLTRHKIPYLFIDNFGRYYGVINRDRTGYDYFGSLGFYYLVGKHVAVVNELRYTKEELTSPSFFEELSGETYQFSFGLALLL